MTLLVIASILIEGTSIKHGAVAFRQRAWLCCEAQLRVADGVAKHVHEPSRYRGQVLAVAAEFLLFGISQPTQDGSQVAEVVLGGLRVHMETVCCQVVSPQGVMEPIAIDDGAMGELRWEVRACSTNL